MTAIEVQIRSGVYYDSVVLMQLQRSLLDLPGVVDSGVVMGTEANKELLAQSGLLSSEIKAAVADDLVIVVKATDEASSRAAIDQVDDLLTARRSTGVDKEYHPKSLETAKRALPDAKWALISLPGRYAAGVARQALNLGLHVFLYSDNVSIEDEISLKKSAAEKGLLVMGPDCGTAIVNGIGLGFANKIRSGPIGMVAASGTGLQQVSSRIHQLGSGITHALGTGGRDLTDKVGAVTARQALDLLDRDPQTEVIVLVSKPPSHKVAGEMVETARHLIKPVVVDFIGYASPSRRIDNVYFATTFDETAELATKLAANAPDVVQLEDMVRERFAPGQRYLRGLFSGGTLAYEVLLILQDYLPAVYSNVPLNKEYRLLDSLVSQENTVIDLGEDEFTVGRLHPMMDNDLRIRRLEAEVKDPEVAVLLMDVVLGYGAHPDPAGELAPAIARARAEAEQAGRYLEVVLVVTGTDEDPQDMNDQVEKLRETGAQIEFSNDTAARYVGRLVQNLHPNENRVREERFVSVDLDALNQPLAAINVGLESFTESLDSQGAQVIHVDWRPPASGKEDLMAILKKMKGE